MMKKILFFFAIALALIFMFKSLCNSKLTLSALSLENIEALAADDESGSKETLWVRSANDCVEIYRGKAGKHFSFTIAGERISGTYDRNGEAEHIVKNGETHCKKGGDEQCTATNCNN